MCLREKIGPDPRNFNQRVSLGRNDLLIRTFPSITPFLPKTTKVPAGRVITGLSIDLNRKRILYAFGFTRNNVG